MALAVAICRCSPKLSLRSNCTPRYLMLFSHSISCSPRAIFGYWKIYSRDLSACLKDYINCYPYKVISRENAKTRQLNFIIVCNVYFFQIFQLLFTVICSYSYIISTSFRSLPLLKFFTQLRTLHFSTLLVNKFFCLVFYPKLTSFCRNIIIRA